MTAFEAKPWKAAVRRHVTNPSPPWRQIGSRHPHHAFHDRRLHVDADAAAQRRLDAGVGQREDYDRAFCLLDPDRSRQICDR